MEMLLLYKTEIDKSPHLFDVGIWVHVHPQDTYTHKPSNCTGELHRQHCGKLSIHFSQMTLCFVFLMAVGKVGEDFDCDDSLTKPQSRPRAQPKTQRQP